MANDGFEYSYQDGQPKPGQGYQIIIGAPQPPPDQFQQPHSQIKPEMQLEYDRARLRNMHAAARSQELNIILDSMRELRKALNVESMQVGPEDNGATTRPPLEPSFDEINRGKLQNCYLRLAERVVNYTENMMSKQLDIVLTNEIKKKEEEIKLPSPDASAV